MITVRWDKDSERWIAGLTQFSDLLFRPMRDAIGRTLSLHVLPTAKELIPVFEGSIRDDLRVLGIERVGKGKRLHLVGTVGFTDKTKMPEMESTGGPAPFSVPWGKHSPGAKAHKVYLYHHGTGGSTKGRQKLIRWLKQNADADYSGLPAAPTKEAVTEWQKTSGLPPWVVVHPSITATNYLLGLARYASTSDMLVRNVMMAVKLVWER